MSKGKELLKNTVIYSIGSIGSKILSFALLPIYSFYLSKSELGIYDLILTTISLVVPIITLQLSQANYRWLLSATDAINKKKAISNTFFALVFLICISILIYLTVILFLDIPYKIYFIFLIISTSFFSFFQDFTRGIKNNKLYAAIGIIYSIILLLLTLFLLIILKWNIEGLLLASILSNIVAIVFIIFRTRFFLYLDFRLLSFDELKQMIRYSSPLIPNTISWWLINASNRYIILWGMGIEANGLFAISGRFPGILTIINSIFMLAWQDHIIQDKSEDNKFSGRIFELYLKTQMSVTIVLIVCSKYIVKYLFSNNFFESWKFMGILFLASAFSAFGSYYGAIYLREKKTIGLFTTTLYGGLVNVFFSILFIKQIGLFAPAIGSLLGFFVVYVIRHFQTKSFFPIVYNKNLIIILCVVAFILLYLSLLNNSYIDVFLIVSSFILAFYLNKGLLKQVMNIAIFRK